MSKVFLTCAAEPERFFARRDFNRIVRASEVDVFGEHEVVDNPASADIIIFVERIDGAGPLMEKVRADALYKRFREKCVVVNTRYKRYPIIPGVYASLPDKWHRDDRTRSSHYFEVWDNEQLVHEPATGDEQYLFSFTGSYETAPVRKGLLQFESDPRALVKNTADDDRLVRSTDDTEILREYRRAFVETIHKSKFVLCPRGYGPSSLRLFESLLMGRPPVIIADEWVAPSGIAWDEFSIRIPESKMSTVPAVLREREEDFPAMAYQARKCWDEWFSEEATFHRLVDWCLEIIPRKHPTSRDWKAVWHQSNPISRLKQLRRRS